MTRIFNKPEVGTYRSQLRNNPTDAERKLWSKLRKRQFFGYRFVRQFSIGKYIVDFYSPELRSVIELDGSQHMDEKKRQYDQTRTGYLNRLGITVLRYWDNDVLENIDSVLQSISNNLTPPNLPFQKRGGV